MKTSLTIVTGASRGMGAAIAEQLLQPEHAVLCISRRTHPTLTALAAARGATLWQWTRDLAEAAPVADELAAWLAALPPDAHAEVNLINNAALLSRIGPVDEDDPAAMLRALRVGLEAPLLLSAAFVRATAAWPGRRRILNISSGLGRRAMAGSAVYCAVKAGLDHLSRAMALDEAGRPNGVRIVSLAPGVIDTDMQVQLRSADDRGFPDKPRFVALQTQGQLSSPAEAARRVIEFLRRPDFGDTVIADVREAG
jgi:benzil reductase ((S)-benzoin forming)